MAVISVRGLDDAVWDRLRGRAARNGRSMEAEIRVILSDAVGESPQALGLAQALMARFGAAGGVDIELPARADARLPTV
jgi:plasmid stability protein